MLYAFELSGDHEEIAAAEVFACLETEGIHPKAHMQFDHCIVADIPGEESDIEASLKAVAHRIAMCHNILKVIAITKNNPESIRKAAEDSNISTHINPGQTFVVRARRVKHNTDINCAQLEGRVGGAIFRKGFHADLKNPDVTFRIVMSEKAIFGSIIASVDRKAFHDRAPHKKPFFYPGVLMPIMGRAIVNLTCVKKGMKLLDPFCGTAGILTEAGLLGVKVVGIEVRYNIIQGAKLNLEWFKSDFSLVQGDASNLPFADNSFDAIVTDPPYGRSAMIKAESLEKLYHESFREMFRVLKKGRKAVIVSEIPANEIAEDAGFTVLSQYQQRVHRSLTRNIIVLQK
ncbi:TRM11 family methyltransferase [Methanohalophilus sp.]|uniref:TRM11 family SAM-dependent methyltransferase n=1 Tax=Methanohalophilus sp. TaxID=1966352 RepID=UPI0026082FDC|nr:TRM11 family methyltransferase [Methanohalophilus sp.]MDK2892477.1 tRNA (guanine10-N2)-dimethyltransferase [Methanohalophilus sp.]